MKVQPKHMTAYVELEITDYKKFEQLVEDWSFTERGCSGTLMFEWYISDCKQKPHLLKHSLTKKHRQFIWKILRRMARLSWHVLIHKIYLFGCGNRCR